MRTTLSLTLVLVGCVVGWAWAGPGPGGGGGGGGGGPALTPIEVDDLLFMREEEKLARDVYVYLGGLHDLPIFTNIASSEQRHMDAVLTLLVRYGLEDPAAGNEPGEFTDPGLQALYDQLIVQGSGSLDAALRVGVLIEETDIADLEDCLLDVIHNDIQRVYENLLRGSQNHLAAFQSHLDGSNTPDMQGGSRNRMMARQGVAAKRSESSQCGRSCGAQQRTRAGNGRCNGTCGGQGSMRSECGKGNAARAMSR